jgi:hypothetical protein
MADIRCCNVCINRPEKGKGMYYCAGCCNFVCTRFNCQATHAKKCKHALGDPIANPTERPAAAVREIEGRA